MCTHIPSLLDLPLTPPQSQPSRSPQNTELGFLSIQKVPTGYLFYTRQCTYINPNLPIHPPPSVPRCPFSTSPWFFWSFLQLLPLSLSWVGCLSPFHLFLLELYLASSLQHVSVTSFCLTCFFYFVEVVLYLPAVHSPCVTRPKCCNVCSCEGLFFAACYVGGLVSLAGHLCGGCRLLVGGTGSWSGWLWNP